MPTSKKSDGTTRSLVFRNLALERIESAIFSRLPARSCLAMAFLVKDLEARVE